MPPTSPPDNAASLGSRKRSRLDEEEPAAWTRHPTLYMQDGSIVLLAENTVFRTYGGLLSKHSEVFNGMGSLSSHQPPDAETYDGCPLVRLSDNPEDLGYFLEALVDINFFPASTEAIPFHVVAGVLRLSTKYMVLSLRKRAIVRLTRAYPIDYDGYINESSSALETFGSLEDIPHPFELVSLLRECRVTRLLPVAFFKACSKGLKIILTGEKIGEKTFRPPEEDARVAALGLNCLHTTILRTQIRLSFFMAEKRCNGGCATPRSRIVEGFLDDYARSQAPQLWFILDPECGICASCAVCWVTLFQKEIRKIWNQIPAFFGLPDWEVLRDEALAGVR